jgi:hypothetical protein
VTGQNYFEETDALGEELARDALSANGFLGILLIILSYEFLSEIFMKKTKKQIRSFSCESNIAISKLVNPILLYSNLTVKRVDGFRAQPKAKDLGDTSVYP